MAFVLVNRIQTNKEAIKWDNTLSLNKTHVFPLFVRFYLCGELFALKFFTQTVLIELVTPQAVQLGIHFKGKKVMLLLLVGPVLGHITQDRGRKKAQPLAGIKPSTSLLQGLCSIAE